jgi:hypothetical protein
MRMRSGLRGKSMRHTHMRSSHPGASPSLGGHRQGGAIAIAVSGLGLVGCLSTAARTTPDTTATAPTSSQTPANARKIPALQVSCGTDADCELLSDEPTDDAPRTYACCTGCVQRAANRTSVGAFRAACAQSPAPMCPPIGCVQPIVRAACISGSCAIAR